MFNKKPEFIVLKDDAWLKRQKIAGKAVSSALKQFVNLVRNDSNISLLDIQKQSLEILESFDCTATFYNYEGFPGSVCLSVNKGLVHGIPIDYILQDGDVVTLDLGATYEGAIADAAFTCIFGTPKQEHIKMLELCQKGLNNGIKAVEVGKRIGAIGSAIFKTFKNQGYGIVDEYGGHGIDYNKPHAPPFVANKSRENEGPIIQKGLSIAIEPMLIMGGSNKTKVAKDKWTVEGKDIGCHFEHSVSIDKNGKVHVITKHDMNVLDFY